MLLFLLICVNGDTLKLLTVNGPVFLRVIDIEANVAVIVLT